METIVPNLKVWRDLIGYIKVFPFHFALHFITVIFRLNNIVISVRGQNVKRYCIFSPEKSYMLATVTEFTRNYFLKANFVNCPFWS